MFLLEDCIELIVEGESKLANNGDILRFICSSLKELLAQFKHQVFILLELQYVLQSVLLIVPCEFVQS